MPNCREAGLNRLADFLIAVADLFEAEGRALRRALARVGQGLGLAAVATVLAAAGMGLLLWALYQYLETVMGPATTALVTGLATLFAAGVLAWTAHRITR